MNSSLSPFAALCSIALVPIPPKCGTGDSQRVPQEKQRPSSGPSPQLFSEARNAALVPCSPISQACCRPLDIRSQSTEGSILAVAVEGASAELRRSILGAIDQVETVALGHSMDEYPSDVVSVRL